MNVKAYYQKSQELERTLTEPFVVIVSHDTPDGGKKGLLTEVPKRLAARMVADGRAYLATAEAAHEFREKTAAKKRGAEELLLTHVPALEPRKSTRPAKA